MCATRTLTLFVLVAACSGVEDPGVVVNDSERITTVVLTLLPSGGGPQFVAAWADPEDDGDPVIDAVELAQGETYTVTVAFLDELQDPPQDLSEEVADEAEAHQVFFTGSGVVGPASDAAGALVEHAYDDTDAVGQPLGLRNVLTGLGSGQAEVTVTLRHLPDQDGQSVKGPDLAAEVAQGGFAAIGGNNDAQVTFPLVVQ